MSAAPERPPLTTAGLRLPAGQRRRGLRWGAYCRYCWDEWRLYAAEARRAPIRCGRCGHTVLVSRTRPRRRPPTDLSSALAAAG